MSASTPRPAAPAKAPATPEPAELVDPTGLDPTGVDPTGDHPDVDGVDGGTAEPEAPLNRAERRARAKGALPSHVGPQAGRTAPGRTGRSHTKRQIG